MDGTNGNNNIKQEGGSGDDMITPEPIDATTAPGDEDTAAVVAAAAAAVMEATADQADDTKATEKGDGTRSDSSGKTSNGTQVHQHHQHYPAQQQHQPWPYPHHPYYYPPHPHYHYPHVPPVQQQTEAQPAAQDQQRGTTTQQQTQPGATTQNNNQNQPPSQQQQQQQGQQAQNEQDPGKNAAQPQPYAGYPPYHYNPYYPHYPPAGYQHHQVQPPAASNPAQTTAATGAALLVAGAGVPPPMADVTDNNTGTSSPASKKRKKDNKNQSIPHILVEGDPRVPPSNKLLYSHSGLGIGAFVRLEGLLTRESYHVRDPFDRSFEGYGGKVIGYDPALQRWSIKVEFRHARSLMPYQAILQCLPQNMCVEEMAPQRNPTDGSIVLDRNAGGFAVGERHLLWECEERADQEDWTGNQADSAGNHRSLSREEESIIREALLRINDCSRQLIPFLDETKKQYSLYVSRDKVKPEIYHAMSRGRDLYKWPRDRLCVLLGGATGTGPTGGNGPHLCGMAAVFGPQHNRCLCEYCFCGYIGKGECDCNAVYWALCSTMGWTQEIKDFDIESVRSTVVYAARQVAMYPPFRLFDTHYPGISEDDSCFPPLQAPDKANDEDEDDKSDKDTGAEKENSKDDAKDDDKVMSEEQERYKKEIEDKGIRWEVEVLPGVWRRYQPFLESRIEKLHSMGSPHYLYRPGNKAVEGTFLNLPDGHGRVPPDTVATRRVLFDPQWREIEMHTGLCARVRRTGPPATKDADGNKATTDDGGTTDEAAGSAAATEGDPAVQSEKGENDPSPNKDVETEATPAAEDEKEGAADSATPASGAGEGTVQPLSLDQSNTQEAEISRE